MNNGIDLPLLRCFVALMTTRSVTAAARQLNVSQPAMSRSLARLRAIFSDPLLVRSRDGMVPTERANQLYRTTRDILGGVDSLFEEEGAFDPRRTRTTFIISATEYVEYVLLPRLTQHTQLEALTVNIEVRVPHRDFLLGWLERGEIDALVGYLIDPPPVLRSRLLFRDRLVCIARAQHPVIRDDLSLEQFLTAAHARPALVGGAMSELVIDAAVANFGRTLRILMNVKNYLTIPFIVAQSDMLATVPYRLARQFADQLDLQILKPPIELPEFRYALYWHERRHQEPRHRWLRRLLAGAARGL